jgi:hypothetical protein
MFKPAKIAIYVSSIVCGMGAVILCLWAVSPKPSSFLSDFAGTDIKDTDINYYDFVETSLLAERSMEITSWLDGSNVENWREERQIRETVIAQYLENNSSSNAVLLGFSENHTPSLGWNNFNNSPVGYNGVPYVLLKTILDLNGAEANEKLKNINDLWWDNNFFDSKNTYYGYLSNIGTSANPIDYESGVLASAGDHSAGLPYGYAWQTDLEYRKLIKFEEYLVDARLYLKNLFPKLSLITSKFYTLADEMAWEQYRHYPSQAGVFDRVHFSCAACHVGRVVVNNRIKFLPGAPNTEVDAQLYSKLIMYTAAMLVKEGFDPESNLAQDPSLIKPDLDAIAALHNAMLDKVSLYPDSFYGIDELSIARAKLQVMWVSDNFPNIINDFIALGLKTHFIYRVAAENNAYKDYTGDVFAPMSGQMDAFGIASGLVALHMKRPDLSFINYIITDNPNNPILKDLDVESDNSGGKIHRNLTNNTPEEIASFLYKTRDNWLPQVPAPIDIKAVNWVALNELANWDGNQGASSRTLSSGASATGDPRYVNVSAHEPLNPFINHLPPTPYPFDSVDITKAKEGKVLFQTHCASCHKAYNDKIYRTDEVKTDPNRTLLISNIARYGLAALVMEACSLGAQSENYLAEDYWCMPQGNWEDRITDYFADTPLRVEKAVNGYKADPLFGIWSQSPYLHNGSVPTLGHLICASVRPDSFYRGNINFDEKLIGFEWSKLLLEPYSQYEMAKQKLYDTSKVGFSNDGHYYGQNLCPDMSGLDPHEDRIEIENRIQNSDAGMIIEYLKIR